MHVDAVPRFPAGSNNVVGFDPDEVVFGEEFGLLGPQEGEGDKEIGSLVDQGVEDADKFDTSADKETVVFALTPPSSDNIRSGSC